MIDTGVPTRLLTDSARGLAARVLIYRDDARYGVTNDGWSSLPRPVPFTKVELLESGADARSPSNCRNENFTMEFLWTRRNDALRLWRVVQLRPPHRLGFRFSHVSASPSAIRSLRRWLGNTNGRKVRRRESRRIMNRRARRVRIGPLTAMYYHG